MTKELKKLDELEKNKGFKVGDIAYVSYGVGELNIEQYKILKLKKGWATVKGFGSVTERHINVSSLVHDRDLIQEVFDFIKNGGIND